MSSLLLLVLLLLLLLVLLLLFLFLFLVLLLPKLFSKFLVTFRAVLRGDVTDFVGFDDEFMPLLMTGVSANNFMMLMLLSAAVVADDDVPSVVAAGSVLLAAPLASAGLMYVPARI